MTAMPAALAALAARSAASTTDGAPSRSTMPCWKSIRSKTEREPDMGAPPEAAGIFRLNLSDQPDELATGGGAGGAGRDGRQASSTPGTTGGRLDHGKLIHRFVRFHT